jgi:hypothetical protein
VHCQGQRGGAGNDAGRVKKLCSIGNTGTRCRFRGHQNGGDAWRCQANQVRLAMPEPGRFPLIIGECAMLFVELVVVELRVLFEDHQSYQRSFP